ncbi:MAG: glycosyltransferase family 4 protein [Ferruginibacter sp.]
MKKFEQAIASKATFIAVSKADADVYKQSFNANDIHFLPVFSPYTLAVGKEGKGCFCLYHGNLAINENEEAATWLLQNVFNNIETPFVIAGKKPTARLQKLVGKYPNACMVANPTNKEMQDMICKAHVHVLPSLNKTGVKLKLLNALFNGRHCLGNKAAVNGSGVEKYCHIAEDASSFKQKIKELYQQPFTQQEIEQRQGLLQTQFNNEVNANKLMTFLW